MRPPVCRRISQHNPQRLACECVCGGNAQARQTEIGVPPGLPVACRCLPITAALPALRDRAPERYVGCYSPERCGDFEPGAAETTRPASLFSRGPGTHVVPGAASIVRQP